MKFIVFRDFEKVIAQNLKTKKNMKSIKYDKLIRDKIPEIIEKSGKKCVVEVMDDETYMDKLSAKLKEELAEVETELKNNNDEAAIKELADLQEVILAIVDAIGVDRESFERIRKSKVASNGAFEKKLLLKEVIEE